MAANGAYARAMREMRAAFGHKLRETGAALREAGSDQIFLRHRTSLPFNGVKPFKTNDTFIAPNATVVGDVTNWDKSSVWYGAVVRADSSHPIEIGFCSSVGSGSVVCTLPASTTLLQTGFVPDCHIGHYVTIGSGCILKSCRVDDLVIIGDKCTIGEGAIIENNVILEPGSVVPAYSRIPSGQCWGGNPVEYKRDLTAKELDVNTFKTTCNNVHELAKDHILELLPVGHSYVHLEELQKQAKEQEEAEVQKS